jgi:hypothetical protein
MTTLTVIVPDEEAAEARQLLASHGNVLNILQLKKAFMDSDEAELQASLKRGLEEVALIESGQRKGLSFEELWND